MTAVQMPSSTKEPKQDVRERNRSVGLMTSSVAPSAPSGCGSGAAAVTRSCSETATATASEGQRPQGKEESYSGDPASDLDEKNMNPYMKIISRRMRNLRKRLGRMESTEKTLESDPAAREKIQPEQLCALEQKSEVIARLKEQGELMALMKSRFSDDQLELKMASEDQGRERGLGCDAISQHHEYHEAVSLVQLLGLFYMLKELEDPTIILGEPLSTVLKTLRTFRTHLFQIAESAETTGDMQRHQELYAVVKKLAEASSDRIYEEDPVTYKDIQDEVCRFTHAPKDLEAKVAGADQWVIEDDPQSSSPTISSNTSEQAYIAPQDRSQDSTCLPVKEYSPSREVKTDVISYQPAAKDDDLILFADDGSCQRFEAPMPAGPTQDWDTVSEQLSDPRPKPVQVPRQHQQRSSPPSYRDTIRCVYPVMEYSPSIVGEPHLSESSSSLSPPSTVSHSQQHLGGDLYASSRSNSCTPPVYQDQVAEIGRGDYGKKGHCAVSEDYRSGVETGLGRGQGQEEQPRAQERSPSYGHERPDLAVADSCDSEHRAAEVAATAVVAVSPSMISSLSALTRSQASPTIPLRRSENVQEEHDVSNSRSGSGSRSDSTRQRGKPQNQHGPKLTKNHPQNKRPQQILGPVPDGAQEDLVQGLAQCQLHMMHAQTVHPYPQSHPTQYQRQEPAPQQQAQLHIQPYLHQHYYQYPHYYYPGYQLSYGDILTHEVAPSDADAVGVAGRGAGAGDGGAEPQRQQQQLESVHEQDGHRTRE